MSLEKRFERSQESIKTDRNLYFASGIVGTIFCGAVFSNYLKNLVTEGNFTEPSTYFDLGIATFTGALTAVSGIIAYYGASKNIIK